MINTFTHHNLQKYIKDEYKFIVRRVGFDDPWTFEKTEEDAINRVKIETDAYLLPEWQFEYRRFRE